MEAIHELRNYREKIYISYDSTNKNCQAGDIKMVEFGHPKVDMGEPVFNYAVAYDTHNQEAGCHKKRRDPVSSCKKWAVI